MADSLLIQALYGPKPSAPGVDTAQVPEAPQSEHIHPARREAIALEGPLVDESLEPVPIEITGSNNTPVNKPPVSPMPEPEPEPEIKPEPQDDTNPRSSEIARIAAPLKEIRTTSRQASIYVVPANRVNQLPSPTTLAKQLRFPIQRYLPPAGEYFDQESLSKCFGEKVRVDACNHCRCKDHKVNWRACGRPCGFCATKQHQGKGCPRLYCTYQWYSNRQDASYANGNQIRPNLLEATILAKLQVIAPVRKGSDLPRPIWTHNVVQVYYQGKEYPKAIEKVNRPVPKIPNTMVTIHQSMEPWTVSSEHSYNPFGSRHQPYPGQHPNLVLPPHGTAIVPSALPASTAVEHRTGGMYQDGISTAPNPNLAVHGAIVKACDCESRIEELEDNILELQKRLIGEGREIRRLKAELQAVHFAETDSHYRAGVKRRHHDDDAFTDFRRESSSRSHDWSYSG